MMRLHNESIIGNAHAETPKQNTCCIARMTRAMTASLAIVHLSGTNDLYSMGFTSHAWVVHAWALRQSAASQVMNEAVTNLWQLAEPPEMFRYGLHHILPDRTWPDHLSSDFALDQWVPRCLRAAEST